MHDCNLRVNSTSAVSLKQQQHVLLRKAVFIVIISRRLLSRIYITVLIAKLNVILINKINDMKIKDIITYRLKTVY